MDGVGRCCVFIYGITHVTVAAVFALLPPIAMRLGRSGCIRINCLHHHPENHVLSLGIVLAGMRRLGYSIAGFRR